MGGAGEHRLPPLQQGLPAGGHALAQARQLVLEFREGRQDVGKRLSRMLDSIGAQSDRQIKEIPD
jgi:hypothetical protein